MKKNKDHKTPMNVIFILFVSLVMTGTGCAGSLYPLHTAAGTGGDIDKVRELLAQGADVNVKGRADRTPLMSAVYYGNFEIAKLLIEKGADIETAIMFLEGVYSDKRAALAGKNWLVQYQTALKSQKPVANDVPEKLPLNASTQVVNAGGLGQSNPASTRQKLAVLDLEAVDVDTNLAYSMSVALRDELHSYGQYEILSREDLMAIAKRLSLQQAAGDDCADDRCLVSYGRSLGTRFMVAGVLSKVGTTYSVSLRILDTEGDKAGVMNRVSERCKCSQDELFGIVAMAAAKLIGANYVPPTTLDGLPSVSVPESVIDEENSPSAVSTQPPQPSSGDMTQIWVESNGEALMGEMDTIKEVKDRAKRDAQSRAVEKAVGAIIKSHTLVSNNQVADDLIYAAVRGKIEKMEVLKEGWDKKDRNLYRFAIKALVEPVYPEGGQGLSMQVALSRTVLKEGEDTKVLYQASSDCYVYIFSVAADGSVTLLLPNSRNKDNRVLANNGNEFPPAGSQVKLEAMFLPDFHGEFAEERIKVIATRKEEPIVPLGFQESMFKLYDASSTGMINDLVKKLNQLEPTDWTEATATYRIVRK